jgi:hypothetical protein
MHASQTLLPAPSEWTQLNTYPQSFAECVIDAIWSERVRYTTVIEIIDRYRDFRRGQGANADQDGASELAQTFSIGLDAWIDQIGNHQRVYAKSDAPYKAGVVHQAAEAAIASGLESVSDLVNGYAKSTQEYRNLHQRWLNLPGQHSGLSWARLALVAGVETVPVDPWLAEFASSATGAEVPAQTALGLINAAATSMDVAPLRLRNAIWEYQTHLDAAERATSPAESR